MREGATLTLRFSSSPHSTKLLLVLLEPDGLELLFCSSAHRVTSGASVDLSECQFGGLSRKGDVASLKGDPLDNMCYPSVHQGADGLQHIPAAGRTTAAGQLPVWRKPRW